MYLLDANAFMEASRWYYAFDLVPSFWVWLGDNSFSGIVASIAAIKDEIAAGQGDLVEWARARPEEFWLKDTSDVVSSMQDVAEWATSSERQYKQEAVDEFFASADFKLIAHAIAAGATLVTREQPAPESKKKIKIPDVCNAFGIRWTDPFSMYRALGMRLGGQAA